MIKKITFTILLLTFSNLFLVAQTGRVVISEVFYDSPLEENITYAGHHIGEFIELYNTSNESVNISGWRISEGLNRYHTSFVIPSGVVIDAKSFILVSYGTSANFTNLKQLFPEIASYQGKVLFQKDFILYNKGEVLLLYDKASNLVDYFSYYNEVYNNYTWNLIAKNGKTFILGNKYYSLQRFVPESFMIGVATNPTHFKIAYATPFSLPGEIAYLQSEFFNYHLSGNQNFVYKAIPQIEIKDISVLNYTMVANSDITENVTYYDGLGRPIQKIDINQSPAGNDVVQQIKYDELGRETKSFLPYTISGSGVYKDDIYGANVISFYKNQSNIAYSDFPYAVKVFDNSPLNRVVEQGTPGVVWQPSDPAIHASFNAGHTIKYNYLTNSATEVKRWDINMTDGSCVLNANIYYPANTLFKNETIDENGNSIFEFTDLNGKTILKKTFNNIFNDDGSFLQKQEICTYYIYDDFDRLRYVLPPNAVDAIGTSSFSFTDFTELIYYYKYDEKGRMVEKKIPGADKVLMVYDKRDRLVLLQDGNMRTGNKWMFTKYDILNRPVFTGIITTTRLEADIRADFNNTTYGLYETKTTTGIGYTLTNSFPATYYTITENNILSVTYYDNYSFLSLAGFSGMVFDNTSNSIDDNPDNIDGSSNGYSNWTNGQVTGSMIKVLDGAEYTASAKKKFSVNYYDDKLRVIQSIEKGYDNSENLISNKFNFAGLVLKTRQIHTAYSKEYIIDKDLEYDHAGRLLKVWQTITGAISKSKILMAEMTYNELGQLIEKKLHNGLQDIDYEYNIRGWLTQINNPNDLGTDLFGMKLLYNEVSEKGTLDGNAQYNGNISGMIWNSKSIEPEPVRGYGFKYDNLNRLLSADYGEFNTVWTDFDTKYNVPKISYDKAGNILSLTRYGASGVIDKLSYGYESSNFSNKLNYVNDNGTTEGFANGGSGANEYLYDLNGNITKDDNKGLSNIQYNILNLPKSITKGSNSIAYIYDAASTKLVNLLPNSKAYKYLGNFVYNETNVLEYILTDEGRLYVDGTSAKYEYYLKDHLGNTRVVFDETGATPVQTNHYYPFGMRFNNAPTGNPLNKYLYNGKELQEETDWLDFGARMYDSELGRWLVIDPLSEKFNPISTYAYCINNPNKYIDIDGREVIDAEFINNPGYQAYLSTKFGSMYYNLFKTGDMKNHVLIFTYNVEVGGGSNFGYYNKQGNQVSLSNLTISHLNGLKLWFEISYPEISKGDGVGDVAETFGHETFLHNSKIALEANTILKSNDMSNNQKVEMLKGLVGSSDINWKGNKTEHGQKDHSEFSVGLKTCYNGYLLQLKNYLSPNDFNKMIDGVIGIVNQYIYGQDEYTRTIINYYLEYDLGIDPQQGSQDYIKMLEDLKNK